MDPCEADPCEAGMLEISMAVTIIMLLKYWYKKAKSLELRAKETFASTSLFLGTVTLSLLKIICKSFFLQNSNPCVKT